MVVNDREPKIAQLVPGSWAQRSDVLCVGDRIMSVNGMAADSLSHSMLARNLDESDRIQLEVRYRLPPQPTILGRRKKVVQVCNCKDFDLVHIKLIVGLVIRKLAHNICRTKFIRQLKYLYLHLYNSTQRLIWK